MLIFSILHLRQKRTSHFQRDIPPDFLADLWHWSVYQYNYAQFARCRIVI